MVEAELPAPVSGHSPVQLAVMRGWTLSFKALVEGYIRAITKLGFAPEEGAAFPMQVWASCLACASCCLLRA